MNYGKRTVVIFAIDQPRCSLVYGIAPCQAVLGGTGARKCFNTIKTCQDSDNFTPETLTLYFVRADDRLPLEYGPAFACLKDVDTSPGRINVAGMEDTSAPFGRRESITVALSDFLDSDYMTDKYRLERTFVAGNRIAGYPVPEPVARTHGTRARARGELLVAEGDFLGYDDQSLAAYNRGTFWSRWIARNPYYVNMPCRVYEGFEGDALEDMSVRHYIIDRVEGPVNGEVTITAKDVFAKIEARKALAPFPSLGELAADITGTPPTFAVSGGIGNLTPENGGYSPITTVTQGYVNVGNEEIIKVTRSGDTFTVVARAQFGTTQRDHKAGDVVQLVLEFNAQLSHDIAYTLLTTYSQISAALIDKPAWDTLAADVDDLLTARIAKPTPVNTLIGELMVIAGFTLWPDTSSGMVRYRALRAGGATPTITDNEWIMDRSLAVRRRDDRRASQAFVYYAERSPLGDARSADNYAARVITPGPVDNPYGTQVVREVFSRWVHAGGRTVAERCGERIYAMYKDPPLEARFKLDADDRDAVEEAAYFTLATAEVQDEVGDVLATVMMPVAIRRGENDIEVEAMSVRFSADAEDGVRRIFIETDELDLNLRALHDQQFTAPVGDEVIEFIIDTTGVVGSSSAAGWAIRTGAWPSMTTKPTLIVRGRVQGKGADGVAGTGVAGANGLRGGDALLVEVPFKVDARTGKLWAGAGSGGSGGASFVIINPSQRLGSGGSGAGAGNTASQGGPRGASSPPFPSSPGPGSIDAQDGTASTPDSPGEGGEGMYITGVKWTGRGGDGGGPGLPGQDGETPASNGSNTPQPGGLGGPAGNYITGIALVEWVGSPGDVRGNVA